jgi:hypothetical protein
MRNRSPAMANGLMHGKIRGAPKGNKKASGMAAILGAQPRTP